MVLAVSIAIVYGGEYGLAAIFAGYMRWKWPAIAARREGLLRPNVYHRFGPEMSDEQRLRAISRIGHTQAFSFGLFPVSFLNGALTKWLAISGWMGLKPDENTFSLKLRLVGLGVSSLLLWIGAISVARGKLADEILREEATPPADRPPAEPVFWPAKS